MASRSSCSFLFAQNFVTFGFLLINVGFSDQTILSINRRANGDTIQVQTAVFCGNYLCEKYNADLTTSGLGSSCMCKCRGTILQPTTTFYDKVSKCMKNSAITKDNSCTMKEKDGLSSSSLLLLDSNMTNPKKIQLDNINDTIQQELKNAQSIKLSWSYYKSKAWIPGKQTIFTVTSKKEKAILGLPTSGQKIWFLQVSNNLPKTISGLLVKVSLQYVFKDGFNAYHCIMFKVLGRQNVIPTTSPPIATAIPTTTSIVVSSTTVPGTTQTQTDSVSHSTLIKTEASTTKQTTTIPKKPSNDASKDDNQRQLLIAFATGGVALSIAVLLVCLGVFMYFRRKRKHKAKKATKSKSSSRPPAPLPPTSPPHNYEYVVYPALTDNLPTASSIDNASYGRGPDNELIIRTPAISVESLGSRHTNNSLRSNNSTGSAALMAHDYTHLQDKGNDESNSIYQPLIRPHTPCDDNDNEKRCTLQDEESKEYIEPRNNEIPEYMELEPLETEI